MNLSKNSTSLLQICSDGGDGASPNFMIFDNPSMRKYIPNIGLTYDIHEYNYS